MSRDQTYPGANTSAQWFAKAYKGSSFNANVGVLHTTEGPSWPGYGGGSSAPTITAKPNFEKKRLEWRQHFPVDMSARALVNKSGGAETNTLNALQVELVGTCSKSTSRKWAKAGYKHIYWPDAPEWALRDLAEFMAWGYTEHDIRLESTVKFVSYPTSYANGGGQRLSGSKWRNYYGWLGHQHVPENVHGDPGDLPIQRVLGMAKAIVSPPKPASTPNPPIAGDNVLALYKIPTDNACYEVSGSALVHCTAKRAEALRKSGVHLAVAVIPSDDTLWTLPKTVAYTA